MHSSKTLERRAFLASTTALIAACNDDPGGGSSTETGASTEPGSSSGPDSTSTNASTTELSSTAANSSTSTQSTSSGITADASSTSGSSSSGSSSSASSSSQSTTVDISSSSQASSSSDGSSSADATSTEEERPAQDACFEGGGTDAGMSQDAGGGVLCSTNTDNGDHCHPFVLPQSDVDTGFAEATYTLEDGGTGHTHTVTLTTYDVFYLQAGIATEVVSSTEAGHNHICLITCAE